MRLIFEDSEFRAYETETYSDICQLGEGARWGLLQEPTWDRWKTSHRFIYVIIALDATNKYYYVPTNGTLIDKDGQGVDITAFFLTNLSLGKAFDAERFETLYVSAEVFVKRTRLYVVNKTYVTFIIDSKEYSYMANTKKMSKFLLSYLKENPTVVKNVEEYIDPDILAEIYGE